ncbi:cytochrome c [Pragia fontium]|uniref:Cytochrome c n=1 Tax=Pragia fontium TaxID=82985 RepID=A0ABQ5LFH7_9GAMM|nr:cytochrome c [Pragia fontium]GKX62144.1 cytochrome c [Pragia fontium]
MKRLLLWGVIILLMIVALLWWRENRTYNGPVQHVKASEEQISRGQYLVRAADCEACHTGPGRAPFSGGVALDTPFGTIYGTNITPDPDAGIGRWTSDDFYSAITKGVTPSGRHLYPAMPYTSYKEITRKDADDIYAFLMTRSAVTQPAPENQLSFPYNQRMALIGWNMLFLNSAPIKPASIGASEQWLRGQYLSNALGHCGECHSPRGILGQVNQDKPMQGGTLGRILAPDITPEGLSQRGWTPESLSQFIGYGITPQTSAFADMHTVINLSTRYLNNDDKKAMASYLMGDHPPTATQYQAGQGNENGRLIYLNQCAGCHSRDGEGKPHVAVAMKDNSTLRLTDANNLIVSILDGLPAQDFPNGESMQAMPGFAERLSDSDITALVNYLRVTWGGQPENITETQVKALRQSGENK